MKRALSVGRIARTAGKVALVLIALDVIATAATLALGAQWLKR